MRPTPPRIGQRRQLFLDDWIVEQCEGVERRLGQPVKHPDNPVLKREKPWEAVSCGAYANVFWDAEERKLRLYYEARSNPDEGDVKLACAESTDGGRTWVRPELDLFPFGDHQRTNLVWLPAGRALAGSCVFRDEHDADAARRYKLFTGDYVQDPESGGGDWDPRGILTGRHPLHGLEVWVCVGVRDGRDSPRDRSDGHSAVSAASGRIDKR